MVAITDAASDAAATIESAGTIIIKIGSSLLVEDAHGAVNAAWLAGVAGDIAMLREAGKNVVVVSSGAIALGRRELGIDSRELALEENRPPPPPARSRWRMPGARRWRRMASVWRRSCCRRRTPRPAAGT